MPDFLTRRNGTWHFVRRVPAEFTSFDRRSIIRHSTKVRVAEDRNGRRASRIAQKFNEQLEGYWCSLAHGLHDSQISRYEAARRQARTLGFEYLENDQLIALPPEKRLERLEALVTKGVVDDPAARAALLGTEKRSAFLVSKLFEEYQSLVEVELKGMSPNQLRCWRLGRIRAVRQFVEVTGDKPVTEITQADGLDYVDWWRATGHCWRGGDQDCEPGHRAAQPDVEGYRGTPAAQHSGHLQRLEPSWRGGQIAQSFRP